MRSDRWYMTLRVRQNGRPVARARLAVPARRAFWLSAIVVGAAVGWIVGASG